MSKELKLPGNIRLAQLSDHSFRIDIEDEVSGVRFATLLLDSEAVANLVTGHGAKCELELRLRNVGCKHEVKEVFVPSLPVLSVDNGQDWAKRRKAVAAASVLPFEVDGWKARSGDFGNHHRGSEDKGYLVVFFRHVPSTAEDITEARKRHL